MLEKREQRSLCGVYFGTIHTDMQFHSIYYNTDLKESQKSPVDSSGGKFGYEWFSCGYIYSCNNFITSCNVLPKVLQRDGLSLSFAGFPVVLWAVVRCPVISAVDNRAVHRNNFLHETRRFFYIKTLHVWCACFLDYYYNCRFAPVSEHWNIHKYNILPPYTT